MFSNFACIVIGFQLTWVGKEMHWGFAKYPKKKKKSSLLRNVWHTKEWALSCKSHYEVISIEKCSCYQKFDSPLSLPVSCQFSLSFMRSSSPAFVSVSFYMHHNQKASLQLNIEFDWSHPHVTFGMFSLVWSTRFLFDLNRTLREFSDYKWVTPR